jgi:AraC-like DNA-binding protein
MAISVALEQARLHRAVGGLVEIVEAGPTNRRFPDRVTDSLGVCLKRGPAHEVRADGRTVVYPENAVCVRPPGCVWSASATGPVGFISIDVSPSMLPAGIQPGAPMAFAASGALPDVARVAGALRASASPERSQEIALDLVLAVARAGFLKADELRQSAPPRTSAVVREALEASLADPPAIASLARTLGISRFALLRSFKRDFGVTPHAYLVRLRVDRARERLARGGELVEVAHQLGFADQAHMTRMFKRVVGLPPGAYARRITSAG